MEANDLFGLLFAGLAVGWPVLGAVDAGLARFRRRLERHGARAMSDRDPWTHWLRKP
jgi:hypothetical protein